VTSTHDRAAPVARSPRVRRGLAPVPFLAPGVLFLIVFMAIPVGLLAFYTFFKRGRFGGIVFEFTLDNWVKLLEPLYLGVILQSIGLALIVTLLALLIGYPMAYAIARTNTATRNILLLLVILPFWTSFLLRVYAWIGILKNNGLLNNALLSLGLIDQPIQMMQTNFAVYLGIVYSYLPFMILPLYTTLEKMDLTLIEAAADLGCRPWQSFLRITLPLSMPGILAGCLLVFIPAIGEFVIPSLLGDPGMLMIGKVLWTEFFNNRDWPVASAVAIALLLLLVIPIMYFEKLQKEETGGGKPR